MASGRSGFAALTTYSEWMAGPFPVQGVSCQDCHMALVQGETARSDVKIREEGSYRFVNLHRLVGGGRLGQLRRGLDLKILTAEPRGEDGVKPLPFWRRLVVAPGLFLFFILLLQGALPALAQVAPEAAVTLTTLPPAALVPASCLVCSAYRAINRYFQLLHFLLVL